MSAATLATILLSSSPALIDAGVKLWRLHQSKQEEQPSPTCEKAALPALTASQLDAMKRIAQTVLQTPLPSELARSRPALILGLWINAWFESRLRPDAYNGRGEDSVGLFQINRRAHPGHSLEDLQDPTYNTRVMLQIITTQASRYQMILRQGATIHTLAAAITLWAERPKDKEKKAVQRAKALAQWFPFTAKQRALDWKP